MTHILDQYVQPTYRRKPEPFPTPLTSESTLYPTSTSITPLHPACLPPFQPSVNMFILSLVLAQIIHDDTANLPQISIMILNI